MLALVSGGELHADARLILGHDRIVEAGHVDAFVLHFAGEVLRELRVVQHHGADGRLRGLDVEACLYHAVAEVSHVARQLRVERVRLVEHLEHLNARADDRRGQRVGEEVRA